MYLLGGLELLSKTVPTWVDIPANDAGSTTLCSTITLPGDLDLTSQTLLAETPILELFFSYIEMTLPLRSSY